MTANVVAIVLSWNDSDRVIALLDRLRTLTPAPRRVVIVDNASGDGSPARIGEAFPMHEVVRLGTNMGFAGAINCGIEMALGDGAEWVWLLNSDIVLPREALASLLAAAGDERCGMAGAVLTEVDGRVQARGGGRVNLWTGDSRHVVRPDQGCDYLSAACLLARAAMLREIGSFDERYFFYWEDIDLGFRARAAGWTLAVAGDCHVVHREGTSLGRWSEQRWYLLFAGMCRFLQDRAPLPRMAAVIRLSVHVTTMMWHGRREAARGAWRAMLER